MKRFLSLVLALVLTLSIVPSAFAASDEAQQAAQNLYELGLFKGTGTDESGKPVFDLDRTPTRHEAVTMLVRLLGKGEEAENSTWDIPFTDVADWAKPYVGYAYANGLTAGTSATTFGGNNTVTASQYLTFVLRALGYSSGTDFQWDKAWELSDTIGLTDGHYNAETKNFTRGDVAIVSNGALSVALKGQNKTLFDLLNETGFGCPESTQYARYFVADGKYYIGDIGTVEVCKIDGKIELFASLETLHFITCYLGNAYVIDDIGNPFLGGRIRPNYKVDNHWIDSSAWGYTSTIEDEYLSVDYRVTHHTINYKGKELTVTWDGFGPTADTNIISYEGHGFKRIGGTLFSLEQMLDTLDIDAEIYIVETEDGDLAWGIK